MDKTKERIVRFIGDLGDGAFIVQHPDGRLERQKDETNWERLRTIADEEIEQSIKDDPDWEEFRDIDWSKAEPFIPPNKTPISIRLDPDVLAFFKEGGAGYQKRINAVLRSFVAQKKSARAVKKTTAKTKGKPGRAA